MAYATNAKSLQTNDLYNYFLATNIDNICRVCLEKGSKLMPIFDPIKPPHFSTLIMACATVQVVDDDGLPPYICQKCIGKLNVAFQFKTQCESSDTKLRQCIQQLHGMIPPPELASYIEIKKADSESNVGFVDESRAIALAQEQHTLELQTTELQNVLLTDSGVLHDSQETQLQQPQLHTLPNMELQPVPSIQPQQEQQQHSDKDDLPELKLEFGDMKGDICDDIAIVMASQKQASGGAKAKRSQKAHQCDTCGKIFRTKPSLVHHIRIHTGERPYVCHLCDKRFVNGGHLHTHMRTHTGEKNHVCAACSKAFATAQQLTKHTIAIHTSERPYACSYCTKRFASSSNLTTHIKTHTGEKNYHCDQCGKTFSTKGQLCQHMLVHTGEKAFLCDFCNKRFSQKAHLMRHLKIHKN